MENRIFFRCDEKLKKQIKSHATREAKRTGFNVSMSAAIRQLINKGLAKAS